VRLKALRDEFRDRVQFVHVYIREAHPLDGWYMGGPALRDPTTTAERCTIARTSEDELGHGLLTCVDEVDDRTMTAYGAWPDRLFLVDREGRIAYAGGAGPIGFRPAGLRRAILRLLERDATASCA